MKLGITYNVFDDSIELLRRSISTIRNFADHIVVVYQTRSNTNQPAIVDMESLLLNLKKKGFIDQIALYVPDLSLPPAVNELRKRNMGLLYCKIEKCTHIMAMDSDEFYLKDEFKFLKRTMENPAFDGSACQLVTYWKTSEFILNPPETYYVSLIFKLSDRLFENCDFPVLVDPTRRMKSQAVRIFTRQEIEMHHLTAVRRDYRRKLESSSAINNFRPHIERLVTHWTDWHYPEPALMPGNPCQEYNVLKVKDQFNVNYQTT